MLRALQLKVKLRVGPGGCDTLLPMVLFAIAGSSWPVDDRTAEALANSLRVSVATTTDTRNSRNCTDLANAIESALVSNSSTPVIVTEDGAEVLFRQLNIMISNPDTIEPAYHLYLEVRRVLGRLYS